MNAHSRLFGFTLTELLIALLILGVISAFAIPKVLSGSADSHRKAVFKETIGMLSNILYEGVLTEKISTSGNNDASWVLSKVNAIKICTGNSNMQGCWNLDHTLLIPSSCSGFRLPNGAVVVSCAFGGPNVSTRIGVDWNGEEGPNAINDDQLEFVACYSKSPCTTQAPGTIIPNEWSKGNVDSTPGYNALFN